MSPYREEEWNLPAPYYPERYNDWWTVFALVLAFALVMIIV